MIISGVEKYALDRGYYASFHKKLSKNIVGQTAMVDRLDSTAPVWWSYQSNPWCNV